MEDLIALMKNYGGCFVMERDRELSDYFKIRLECRGLIYAQLIPMDEYEDHRDEILSTIVNNYIKECLNRKD